MRRLLALFTLLLPGLVWASSGGVHLEKANNDLHDKASLQNGAKLFVNYCQGCHSAKFMRFNRIGQDVGLTDEQLKENLMFTSKKVGDPMLTAMDEKASKEFFGVVPPDLSVIARARGVDWLYTYLTTFYLDEKRAVGVNNLVFKDVGMPHVLADLQGWQKLNHETGELEPVDKGKMSEADLAKRKADYEQTVRDLVNFLEYMGEPSKLQRLSLGVWVLGFLLILLAVSYWMKSEFWRDVH